jgi:hypothetical protein
MRKLPVTCDVHLLRFLFCPQVGLDLSFVNYVFLMEPLANKATEEQVISFASFKLPMYFHACSNKMRSMCDALGS